ncbi:hypothetical protein [uncultured Photobacterium sp.]|uniref:hypothetical protein n=1 Tax=uncultured Photobacterium sp. TaxID=173973 RepID=UPI002639275E|nr:hypothetical protein [uncultured Photobacterium sp.]
MRIDHQQAPALTKNGQISPKTVPVNETNQKLAQTISTNTPAPVQNSQLTQLLSQLNVLQRFFTTFISHASPSASPVTPAPAAITNLFSQLLMPQNQTALIQWLQQGAGKQILALLLKQANQPDSQLKQWLQLLPTEKQDEFTALLKLATEQRMAPTVKENETTLLQLHLLQPNGREAKLSIEKDNRTNNKRKTAHKPRWRVQLALPIGSSDTLQAVAIWDQHKLALGFESDNLQLLKRTELLSPLLSERLDMLGIRSEPATFKLDQAETSETNVDGFSILV